MRSGTIKLLEREWPQIREGFAGMLIHNLEELAFLRHRGYNGVVQADHNLYVCNRSARQLLQELGVTAFTAPAELNRYELAELDISGSELIVYGRTPLMTTANCLNSTVNGCDRREKLLYLQDRYRKQFPVRNFCRDCYNIIYNSEPLLLAGQTAEIATLGPQSLRLDLTIEDGQTTARLLDFHQAVFREGDETAASPVREYTKGHFKRGVK